MPRTKKLEIITDPAASAKAAGLRYVTDTKPGIQRKPWRKNFRYIDADGAVLRDSETLARIKSLVIPPAWTDVWICPNPKGHLQVTGRDARGRKQSRYHPQWRVVRDETKYERMMIFGQALPAIRERVEHDLSIPGLPRSKVLATVVRLMETTLIRVGSEEYARQNHSYGLTTMRNKHVDIEGSTVSFNFQGKSGIKHAIDITDRRIAKIVHAAKTSQAMSYSNTSTGTAHNIPLTQPTSMIISARSLDKTSPRRTSGLGLGQFLPVSCYTSLKLSSRRPKPNET
jgi:DNA topoisomerase-1